MNKALEQCLINLYISHDVLCLLGFLKGKTCVLITHQIQYLTNMEKIFIMENVSIYLYTLALNHFRTAMRCVFVVSPGEHNGRGFVSGVAVLRFGFHKIVSVFGRNAGHFGQRINEQKRSRRTSEFCPKRFVVFVVVRRREPTGRDTNGTHRSN